MCDCDVLTGNVDGHFLAASLPDVACKRAEARMLRNGGVREALPLALRHLAADRTCIVHYFFVQHHHRHVVVG